MSKPLTVWITTNCGKFFKRWEYQTTWPASWEVYMQVRKQQLELEHGTWNNGLVPNKKRSPSVYCHPAYFACMPSTSWEMPGWMKHKLESRLWGKISIISDMKITPPLWQKWRGIKKPFLKVKEESEKAGLKLNFQKTISNRWGNNRKSEILYFGGLQNHCRSWLQPWN